MGEGQAENPEPQRVDSPAVPVDAPAIPVDAPALPAKGQPQPESHSKRHSSGRWNMTLTTTQVDSLKERAKVIDRILYKCFKNQYRTRSVHEIALLIRDLRHHAISNVRIHKKHKTTYLKLKKIIPKEILKDMIVHNKKNYEEYETLYQDYYIKGKTIDQIRQNFKLKGYRIKNQLNGKSHKPFFAKFMLEHADAPGLDLRTPEQRLANISPSEVDHSHMYKYLQKATKAPRKRRVYKTKKPKSEPVPVIQTKDLSKAELIRLRRLVS